MIADKDTRIIHANPAALAALGKTLIEALNTPILSLFPPESSAELAGALTATREAGAPHSAFNAACDHQELRVVITPLHRTGKDPGWLVALEGALM